VSLITATDLAKSFGATEIFGNISFQLPPGGRIAIVGSNGIGKTTLLRILAGEEKETEGQLQRARGLAIGYLPQEAGRGATHTLWEECLTAFPDLIAGERELKDLERKLSHSSGDAALLAHYGAKQAAFESAGGYQYEARIRNTLVGLGFMENEFDKPLPILSGGQRTRALLTRLLLSKPDLLILDEPTNHLDIQAVEWLEGFLRSWEGSVLIVSHDRYFLDKVVNHIWEMQQYSLESFKCNYTHYAEQRVLRRSHRAEYVETEKARLEKDLAFIRKHIHHGRVDQAKGRLKRLSRQILALEIHGFEGVRGRKWLDLGVRDRTAGVDDAERRLRALKGRDVNNRELRQLMLQPKRRSGNIILRTEGAEIGYPGNSLFTMPKLVMTRLDRVALIGGNGSGKTTFLRTFMEQIPSLSGELAIGASQDIGYFTQAHDDLDPKLTLMEEIEKMRPHWLPARFRQHLGRFNFSGDDHFKKVSMLSGGERGRLALAKLALCDANMLILDEPTNHLDIPSQEVLQEMIASFDGTVLLVSHDRYLVDALATQIWTIDSRNHRLEVFEGRYREYTTWLEQQKLKPKHPTTTTSGGGGRPSPKASGSDSTSRATSGSNAEGTAKPMSKARAKQMARQITEVEERIADLELRMAIVADQLSSPPTDLAAATRLNDSYQRLQAELAEAMEDWERLHED
jgi:ATP-binding cassette, subfamily F, member 3